MGKAGMACCYCSDYNRGHRNNKYSDIER